MPSTPSPYAGRRYPVGTAGQGRSLCAGIDDTGRYLAASDHHPPIALPPKPRER